MKIERRNNDPTKRPPGIDAKRRGKVSNIKPGPESMFMPSTRIAGTRNRLINNEALASPKPVKIEIREMFSSFLIKLAYTTTKVPPSPTEKKACPSAAKISEGPSNEKSG